MPGRRRKSIKYKSIDDFPEAKISASMIANSFLGISAEYVRAGIKTGKYKGYQVGRTCYMTKEQVRENWGTVKNIEVHPPQIIKIINPEILLEVVKLIKDMIGILQNLISELKGVEKDG